MPTPESFVPGAPCWIDLFTSDPDRSRAFYGQLFGWTSEQGDQELYGGYITFAKDGAPVAGAMLNDGTSGAPDGWSVYLASTDAAATAKLAGEHGGEVAMDTMEVPEAGVMAIVVDPAGAMVGIWQPGAHLGFGLLAEPGAPAWFELHTRGYEASLEFYRSVFDWDVHTAGDTPEFRYSTFGADDDALAGVMDASGFLPDGVPSQWTVYFAVEDADASVARAIELGATVVLPPEDTPYGRLTELTDPTGARFKLVQG